MNNRVRSVLSPAVALTALSVLIPQPSAWSSDVRSSVVAQETPNASAKQARELADSATLPMSELREKSIRHYEHNIGTLQRMILEKLTLSSEQRAAIEKMFKEHVAAARANDGAKDRWVAPGANTDKQQSLRELRDEWKKKMADGTAPEIPRAHIFENPEEFLVALSFEINKDQIDKYDAVVKRWQVLRPNVAGDGPIRHILRAAQDTELTISPEVRVEIRKHVMTETRKIGKDKKVPEKLAAFCAKMRKYVLSKLTTEQQAHFTKTLAQIEKDAARLKASD